MNAVHNFIGSIANRVFLILLAGILVATLTTSYLAANERRQTIEALRNSHTAERVEQLVMELDNTKPDERARILQGVGRFALEIEMVATLPKTDDVNTDLVEMLKARLGEERHIAALRETDCPSRNRRRPMAEECQVVYVSLQDGASLKLKLHLPGPRGGPHHLGGMLPYPPAYLGLFLALIALLAYAVAKMTARPIKQLAIAAGEFGTDLDRAPLPEEGPTEIRRAAMAFNAMQARIRRQIQHRTHMLAAITHDLQTPLTRIRLRLEKVSDVELRDKLIDDLAVMQSMVKEGLDLARSMDSSEPMRMLDIDSLLDSVCADASDAGQDVTLTGSTRMLIMAQPNALRRCLTNLLDNAIKYGQHARVRITQENDKIAIRILDGGAGIPEDQIEAVFDPFYRMETSRSRDTGGTGLGLTIARNIVESHSGSVRLKNHPDGGLEVTILLSIKQ
jgi:signal transduction histidine kinase